MKFLNFQKPETLLIRLQGYADCSVGLLFAHYANTPMQYSAIYHGCKNDNFPMKNSDIFLTFAQNIGCGTCTHNLCFRAKIRKKCISLSTPVLLNKSGVKGGYKSHGHVIPMIWIKLVPYLLCRYEGVFVLFIIMPLELSQNWCYYLVIIVTVFFVPYVFVTTLHVHFEKNNKKTTTHISYHISHKLLDITSCCLL